MILLIIWQLTKKSISWAIKQYTRKLKKKIIIIFICNNLIYEFVLYDHSYSTCYMYIFRKYRIWTEAVKNVDPNDSKLDRLHQPVHPKGKRNIFQAYFGEDLYDFRAIGCFEKFFRIELDRM